MVSSQVGKWSCVTSYWRLLLSAPMQLGPWENDWQTMIHHLSSRPWFFFTFFIFLIDWHRIKRRSFTSIGEEHWQGSLSVVFLLVLKIELFYAGTCSQRAQTEEPVRNRGPKKFQRQCPTGRGCSQQGNRKKLFTALATKFSNTQGAQKMFQ